MSCALDYATPVMTGFLLVSPVHW
ncbi:hypothetical protein AVEN_212800-1, partial [Araneus ventricosus]